MKNIFVLSLIFLVLLSFNGCGSDSEDSTDLNNSSYDNDISNIINGEEDSSDNAQSTRNSKYWGDWREVKSQKKLYITSKTDLKIDEVGADLIKIEDNYYFRFGSRNVDFAGNVQSDKNGAIAKSIKGFEDIGGIDILLRNLKDGNIETSTKTETDGTFQNKDLPTGDYSMKIESNSKIVELNVSLVQDNEDLGSFTLIPKGLANFKISFESDSDTLYANEKLYTGKIIVKNVGYDIGTGLNYSISLNGAKSFQENSSIGSIPKGTIKEIPVSFSFSEQFENVKDYKLVVEITSAKNYHWKEETIIQVHKGMFRVFLSAEKEIQGVLKYPNGKDLEFTEGECIKIRKEIKKYKKLLEEIEKSI